MLKYTLAKRTSHEIAKQVSKTGFTKNPQGRKHAQSGGSQ